MRVKINLDIKGRQIELSREEALELRDILDSVVGKTVKEYTYPTTYPWHHWEKWVRPTQPRWGNTGDVIYTNAKTTPMCSVDDDQTFSFSLKS